MTNILYMHSHDTGRCISPYGYPVRTPAFERLAHQGMLFRRAFCVASSCSASRASLQTGQYPHQNGMTGLAHRGWQLFDYSSHLVNYLRRAGYSSTLVGEHHVAPVAEMIGYDEILMDASSRGPDITDAAVRWLETAPQEPWFLSCGFWETHRTSFLADLSTSALDVHVPPPLPDVTELRADAAALHQSIERLDEGVGRVLEALSHSGQADSTLIVATTDHAPGFPGWKANLTDRGLGVYLILAGPGVPAGTVSDALVSHLDLYPLISEIAGLPIPSWVEGASLGPLMRGERADLHEALFAEANYHAAFEPQRAIRTNRFRYIRRFDNRAAPVLPNIDDGPSKDWVMRERPEWIMPRQRRLFDLNDDPFELHDVCDEPGYRDVADELDRRLTAWMTETNDPLLNGKVATFAQSRVNDTGAISASEPLISP